jgi:hypothetical protein
VGQSTLIAKSRIKPYGIKLRIVRITVVVMLVEDVWVGGGGGAATPGESIVPANAETASAVVRIATELTRRNVVTFLYLP